MAAVTFIDEDRQWVKADHGGGAQTSARADSFCAYAICDPSQMLAGPGASSSQEPEER